MNFKSLIKEGRNIPDAILESYSTFTLSFQKNNEYKTKSKLLLVATLLFGTALLFNGSYESFLFGVFILGATSITSIILSSWKGFFLNKFSHTHQMYINDFKEFFTQDHNQFLLLQDLEEQKEKIPQDIYESVIFDVKEYFVNFEEEIINANSIYNLALILSDFNIERERADKVNKFDNKYANFLTRSSQKNQHTKEFNSTPIKSRL